MADPEQQQPHNYKTVPCRFWQQGRCNKGERCTYLHGQNPGAFHAARQPSAPAHPPPPPSRGAQATPPAAARTAPAPHQHQGSNHSDAKGKFRFLARQAVPLRGLRGYQQMLGAALQLMDEGEDSAAVVVEALGGSPPDGTDGFRKHVEYLVQSLFVQDTDPVRRGKVFLDALLPLLRLLHHERFRSSVHSAYVNTALSNLRLWLGPDPGLQAVAAAVDRLWSTRWKPAATATSAAAAGGSTGPLQPPVTAGFGVDPFIWQPTGWLDVLEPCVGLVTELLQRFQQQDAFQQLKEGAGKVLEAVRKVLPTGMEGAPRGRVRTLEGALAAAADRLEHGAEMGQLLTAREAQQRKRQQLAAAATASNRQQLQLHMRSPDYLPGELRPAGPRHDNDKLDYTQIAVEPTPQELLCTEAPYLPPNRPGAITHMVTHPSRELLERHFRLLRHDVVSPVTQVVQSFKEYGGLGALLAAAQQQQAGRRGKTTQGPGRLRLGKDSGLLYVFRNIQFEGLACNPREGVFYVVSFTPPDIVASKTVPEREWWWRQSRRLSHGTMCVLWSEPDGPQHPLLLLAVVMERDEKKLAQDRPRLGIRIVSVQNAARGGGGGGVHGGGDQALRAWLGIGGETSGEIILLQENNAFFAYEPVLRALQAQANRTLPLEKYLAPPAKQPIPTTAPLSAGIVQPTHVQLPTYLDSPDMTLDLTCLCDQERLDQLTETERNRVRSVLSKVPTAEGVQGFPLDELMAATTLDRAQSKALAAGLLREIAVIQGPPGTGKTFLGVKLLMALLHNTKPPEASRNHRTVGWRDDRPMVFEDVPRPGLAARPDIGPVLVVCFTNHALDSFLLGLLNAGMRDIVRVGSSKRTSEELKPYNLENIGERATGPVVYRLMKKRDELRQHLEQRSAQLQMLAQSDWARRLPYWDRGGMQLFSDCLGEVAAGSMEAGRKAHNGPSPFEPPPPPLPRGETMAAAAADNDDGEGWEQAGGGRKGRKKNRNKSQMVITDLVVDWYNGNPEVDWRQGRLRDLSVRHGDADDDRMETASEGSEDSDDDMDEGELEEVLAILPPAVAAEVRQQRAVERAQRAQWRQTERERRRQIREMNRPVPDWVVGLCGSDRPQQQLVDAAYEEDFNIWSLSVVERQRLFQYLLLQRFQELLEGIRDVERDLTTTQKQLQEEYDKVSLATLRKRRVVGMTTSGVAQRKDLVMALAPKVVLVEEAAEVLEAHVLVCLSANTQHLILIGDHEQLRPKPNVYALQAVSGSGLDLDLSLFERLVTQQGFPVETLEQQRRMRPDISKLITPIYPTLRDHPSVTDYPPVKGMVHPLFFLDHDHAELGNDDGASKSNPWEATFCVAAAGYLMKQGYAPEDIIILVTYVGQLFEMKRILKASNFTVVLSELDEETLAQAALDSEDDEEDNDARSTTSTVPSARRTGGPGGHTGGGATATLGSNTRVLRDAGKQIRVATVDNFQGEEGKIILLSTVRNNKKGEIGFLKMRNRINVMLSRAQHGMVVLGNSASLRANAGRSPLWPQVLDQLASQERVGAALPLKCERHGVVTLVREPREFETLVGDGGCSQSCGQLMDCGHVCPRRCHVDDPNHLLVRCSQPCDRLYKPCDHPCSKLCWQECGKCEKIIREPFLLPCGHEIKDVACWKRYQEGAIHCHTPVTLTLPCGHEVVVDCCEADSYRSGNRPCHVQVEVTLPVCGHKIKAPCHDVARISSDPTRCEKKCGRDLTTCGHTCTDSCGKCIKRSLEADNNQIITEYLGTWEEGMRQLWRAQDSSNHPPAERLARWLELLRSPAMTRVGLGKDFCVWLAARLANHPEAWRHSTCTRFCDKPLACGHSCSARCHAREGGGGCPACTQRCTRRCPHHKCTRPCNEPCVACHAPCEWKCAHEGACGMPCGTPCDRLPCDERCDKRLKCGHRCPGVCGEPCVNGLCVDPACMKRAPEKLLKQQVDMVMLREFSELTDEDVSEDPLIQLGSCGHVFTRDTLDGLLNLGQYYEKDAATGRWSHVKSLDPEMQHNAPSCPLCRSVIQGARRYGRPLMKAALNLSDLKYFQRVRTQLSNCQSSLQKLHADVSKLERGSDGKLPLPVARQKVEEVRQRQKAFAQVAELFNSNPKTRAFEAAYAWLQRAQERMDYTPMETDNPQPPGPIAGSSAAGSSSDATGCPAAGSSSSSPSAARQQSLIRTMLGDMQLDSATAVNHPADTPQLAADGLSHPPEVEMTDADDTALAVTEEDDSTAAIIAAAEAALGVGGAGGGGGGGGGDGGGDGEGRGGDEAQKRRRLMAEAAERRAAEQTVAAAAAGGAAGSSSSQAGEGRDVAAEGGSGGGGSSGSEGAVRAAAVCGRCGDRPVPRAGKVCQECTEREKQRQLRQLEAARTALVAVKVDKSDLHRCRSGMLQSVAVALQVLAGAAKDVAAIAGNRAQPPRRQQTNYQRGGRHWQQTTTNDPVVLLQQLERSVMGLYHMFMPRNGAGNDNRQQQLDTAQTWVNDALDGGSYNLALQLAADRVGLLLQLVKATHALGLVFDRTGQRSRNQLKDLLDQVEAEAVVTEQSFLQLNTADVQPIRVDAPAFVRLQDIRREVPRLRDMFSSLSAEEMAVALAAAMGYHVSNPAQAVNMMSGRTYQCPNGHLYVVGECGRTMEEATCAECGARIGGRSHQLRADNRPVGDLMGELRRQQ